MLSYTSHSLQRICSLLLYLGTLSLLLFQCEVSLARSWMILGPFQPQQFPDSGQVFPCFPGPGDPGA